MPRLLRTRAALEVLRGGHLRPRLRATRDGQAAIRLAQLGAGLSTGLLDALAERPAGTAELAGRCDAADEQLLAAFLRALAAAGVVRQDHDRWAVTADGRAVVDDDLVRAAVEAFSGFHTDVYRGMGPLLAGGPRRSDVATSGAVIARVSAAFEPFVLALLTRTAADVQPWRVLDVGCGAGLQLATVLETVPGAAGIGIETDAGAAALAKATLAGRGLAGRSTVVRADVRQVLGDPTGPLAEPVDLVLLANVVHYVPRGERTPLLADLTRCLCPGDCSSW